MMSSVYSIYMAPHITRSKNSKNTAKELNTDKLQGIKTIKTPDKTVKHTSRPESHTVSKSWR